MSDKYYNKFISLKFCLHYNTNNTIYLKILYVESVPRKMYSKIQDLQEFCAILQYQDQRSFSLDLAFAHHSKFLFLKDAEIH